MAPDKSDLKAIEGYISGDKNAFDKIVSLMDRAYLKWQNRFGYEKDDIFSDVQLKLYNSFNSTGFQLTSRLAAFVAVIVNHTCIDYLRFRSRITKVDVSEFPIPDDKPSEEEKLELKELMRINFRAIRLAPKECRRLWRMHLLKGMKCREIGEVLKRSAAYIRRKLWECREMTKKMRGKLLKKANLFDSESPSG